MGGGGGAGGATGQVDAGSMDMAEDVAQPADAATVPDMRPVDLPPDMTVPPPDMAMLPPDAPPGVNLAMGLITG